MQKQRKLHTQIKDRKYNEYHAKVMEEMKNLRMMHITVPVDENMKKISDALREALHKAIVGAK